MGDPAGFEQPLLEKGQAGLDDFVRRARETGGVMTAEMAANAKKMNASWSELGLAIEGVGNRIVDSWSGTATKVLDTTSHWIEHNKDLADSYGKNATAVLAGVAALSAIKPAVWILRALGLLEPTELLAVAGGIGALANQLPPAKTFDDTRTIFTPGGVHLPFAPLGSPFNPAPSSDDYRPPWYERAWHWLGATSNRAASRSLLNKENQERAAGVRDALASDLGITKDQAAGIVSNLMAESGLRGINEEHPLIPGSLGGFGWAQWTGPRRVEFEQWAAAHHLDPSSDEANYGFLVEDLRSGRNAALMSGVRGSADAFGAANAFFPYESGGAASLESQRAGHVVSAPAIASLAGHVQVDVHLHGAPPGTTANAVGTGAVSTSPPRIEHSMPMVGGGWS